MRDHEPIVIDDFLGTFDHGEDEVTPLGHFIGSQNIKFKHKGVTTRDGSEIAITLSSVRRAAIYKRVGENQRLLILNKSGSLFDSTNVFIPILTISAMTDFSMVSIFNRAYITPHNGLTGLQNDRVYVYDGQSPARPAAGGQPTGTSLSASDGGAGHIEAGDRVYAVCFLTKSGYITGPGLFVHLNGAGDKTVNIGNLPIGDSTVIGRIIIATKTITAYDGVFAHQTYYEIPGGTISDNLTTSIVLDFFDVDLENDLTYLLEQLNEIPAGVGIGLYRGRMVTWGEYNFPAIFRASTVGEPESMNSVDGFGTVNPGDSDEGIRNATEVRDQLILAKSRRTYATQDSGDPISAWSIIPIDKSIGTECHGFGRVLDFGSDVEDIVFTADRGGLRVFNGSFAGTPLSQAIKDIWNRINGDYFHTVEMVIDPTNNYLYICVPLDTATQPNAILYADFSEGLDEIKWTTWTFPDNPITIVLDIIKGKPIFKFGTEFGIYKLDDSLHRDYGHAIESWIKFPLLPQESESVINHFTGARVRVKGTGKLLVTVNGLNGSNEIVGENLSLDQTSPTSQVSLFDFTGEVCSVKLRMTEKDDFFNLTKLILYAQPLWDTNG